VVDGAPEIHPPACDPKHHFVEMPSVARPRPALPQLAGDQRTEFQHPAPHRFVGDVEPSLGKQILRVPIAQRETRYTRPPAG
jgi:hypothetical protein